MPLAIPRVPPRALAHRDTANSQALNSMFIPGSCSNASWSASGKAGGESDQITPVVELFIVNRRVACAVRGAFDEQDRAARSDAKRRSDIAVGRGCLQSIFRFDQCDIVALFQKRKN